ncbi:MAG: ABC transporter permease [Acidimicrobiales bacterium]
MSWARTRSLGRAMLRGYVRDPASLFFSLLFPLLFLVIFGAVFGGDEGTRRFDLLATGEGPVIDALPSEIFDMERVDSLAEGAGRVADGDAVAVVAQDGDEVTVRYQASDQVGGQTVLGVVASLVDRANLDALGGTETYTLQTQQVEDESLGGMEFITPGLLSWAVSIGAVFGAALTLVNWRTRGVLRRLRLTPAPVTEIAAARVAVSLGLALAQTALFLLVGRLFFGLDLSGPWWWAFPVVLVGTLAFLSIGLLVGAVASTADAASTLANLVVVPMAFLSGTFVPLDNAPGWMRVVAQVLPLTHLLEALKNVMVLDRGFLSTLPHLAVLVGFSAVCSAAAIRLFRWDQT